MKDSPIWDGPGYRAKYDAVADDLEIALREEFPLLTWYVAKLIDRLPDSPANIEVRVRARVNGETFACREMFSVEMLAHVENAPRIIAVNMAQRLAKAMLEWKPVL